MVFERAQPQAGNWRYVYISGLHFQSMETQVTLNDVLADVDKLQSEVQEMRQRINDVEDSTMAPDDRQALDAAESDMKEGLTERLT